MTCDLYLTDRDAVALAADMDSVWSTLSTQFAQNTIFNSGAEHTYRSRSFLGGGFNVDDMIY